MKKLTKISVFDLDETVARMPSYTASKYVEKSTDGYFLFPTPYSFYDHPLSMDTSIHNIQFISPVLDDWQQSVLDINSRTILITHRTEQLRTYVNRVIEKAVFGFDAIYCLGRVTEKFDTLLKELKKYPEIATVDIYEDTLEQIIKYRAGFESLSRKYEVNFYFVDKSNVFRLLDFKVDEKRKIKLI